MSNRSRLASERWVVIAGLRRWAYGLPADEAAVELLVCLGARFTWPGSPWVKPCPRPGWYWLDPEELSRYAGRLTFHQRRVLVLVVTLLNGQPARTLGGPAAPAELGRAAA